MNSHQKIAKILGVLFLIQLATYYIGHESLLGILFTPNYLIDISANTTQVMIAIVLQLISGAAFVGFAVIVFPILEKHGRSITLGYLGFRFMEFTIIAVSEISLLSLVTLSEEYVKTGALDSSYIQTLGNSILAQWKWAVLILMMVFSLGASLFYYLLFKSNLVPRFKSVWGLIGVTLALAAPLLNMFGQSAGGMIIYLPIGLNELFLAIWLIVKGFNSTAMAPPATSEV